MSGDAMEDVTSLVDSLRLGCEIAYRREPTQAEGDAHEYRHDQSMGASYGASECFVPMGGHHGWRCKCGVWVWGGPTVCQRCVDRGGARPGRDAGAVGVMTACRHEAWEATPYVNGEARRCADCGQYLGVFADSDSRTRLVPVGPMTTTTGPEPRITPAMVRRLRAALTRAHGYVDPGVLDAWAARENRRAR